MKSTNPTPKVYLAHADAAHEFDDRGYQSLEAMQRSNREKAEGTVLTLPTITFEDKYLIEILFTQLQLHLQMYGYAFHGRA